MNKYQQLAIRALEYMKGDNYPRAKAVFRNYTPEQMQKQYGQSGSTCAQILEEYKQYEEEVDAAIKWVKSIINN
jgi:adenylosuccinate synthase